MITNRPRRTEDRDEVHLVQPDALAGPAGYPVACSRYYWFWSFLASAAATFVPTFVPADVPVPIMHLTCSEIVDVIK